MITVKQLIQSTVQSSPDGNHWEPALPEPRQLLTSMVRDAWAVLKGKAVAIRQTTKEDLGGAND